MKGLNLGFILTTLTLPALGGAQLAQQEEATRLMAPSPLLGL